MEANEILSKLVRLSEVKKPSDVHFLSDAMFPGSHCPLMGACMVLKEIEDACVLVVGTEECAYYSRRMTLTQRGYHSLTDRFFSLVIGTDEVVFGVTSSLFKAAENFFKKYSPKVIFLVSTCTVELIGEDMEAAAEELEKKYNISVPVVHTEHFKSENHLAGIENTITSCFHLMKKDRCRGGVNIIGQWAGNFDKTELACVLRENNVKVNTVISCGCSLKSIEEAPDSLLNIIVHPSGLTLAEKMEEKFGTPYIEFFKNADFRLTFKSYKKLFELLKIPLPEMIKESCGKAELAFKKAKEKVAGASYIYNSTPLECMEFNSYLSLLGMRPLIIHTIKVDREKDKDFIQNILKTSDPYIAKTANIAPLQYIYPVLKPHIYVGRESDERLRKNNMVSLRIDKASQMLGLELCIYVTENIVEAVMQAKALRGEI